MSERVRRNPVAVVGLGAGLLAVFVWHVTHHWFSTSDTSELLVGTGVADRCLHAGVFHDCNAAGFGDVSHFALLQYLPALLMKRLGADIQTAYDGLCRLNAVAFLSIAALMWQVGRRCAGPAAGALMLVAGAASPLLWYSHGGFGEPLAALAATAFAAGLVLRWPTWLTALSLFFAVISKEPILPVLAFVAAAALVARPAGERIVRAELGALIASAVLAEAASAAFNVFRFGGVTNSYYLDAAVHPPLADRVSAFGAMLVAPNVGLLWFWPAAVVIAALAIGSAPRRGRRALALLGLGFIALVAGLASFWAPFGWEAWGPRLLLPWVPAFLVVAVAVAGPALAEAIARLWRTRAAAAVVVIALAVPQVAAFRHWQAGFALFDPGRSCPIHLPDVRDYRAAFGETTGYFRCLRRQEWTHPPTLVDAASGMDVAGVAWAALLAAWIALLVLRRRSWDPEWT